MWIKGRENSISRSVLQKYIVYWTWKYSDTERGIELYHEMDKLKAEDSRSLPSERAFPTSLASSYGEDPRWFTLFEATDEQLQNWLKHYEPVLKILDIRPIIGADEFIEKWEEGKITWRYWFGDNTPTMHHE